jgi:glucose 1-dehydrogenase
MGGRATATVCDVRSADDLEQLRFAALKEFGRLDIWINNAGLSGPYGPTLDVPWESFKAVTETFIFGTYHGSMVALRHFRTTGAGCLINLLGRGERRPVPMQNAYGSAKSWVRNFTLALNRESAKGGIRIAAFQPGLMSTAMVLEPDVLAGHEDAMRPLGLVLRLWGATPAAAARGLVDKIASGTRRALWRGHGRTWFIGGPLRNLVGKRPEIRSIHPHVIASPSLQSGMFEPNSGSDAGAQPHQTHDR